MIFLLQSCSGRYFVKAPRVIELLFVHINERGLHSRNSSTSVSEGSRRVFLSPGPECALSSGGPRSATSAYLRHLSRECTHERESVCTREKDSQSSPAPSRTVWPGCRLKLLSTAERSIFEWHRKPVHNHAATALRRLCTARVSFS